MSVDFNVIHDQIFCSYMILGKSGSIMGQYTG
jgi:hypothetical protein